MIADIGYLAIILSLLLSIYAIIASAIYLKTRNIKFSKSSNGAVYGMLLLSSLAIVSLLWLLFKGDFSVKYVYEYTSSDLSWFYRLTALWAGNDGSLLLWLWLLIIYTAIVVKQNKIKDATPISVIILLINSFFFLPEELKYSIEGDYIVVPQDVLSQWKPRIFKDEMSTT